jgi:sugar/nucleoside kinase (ribokinase family)
MNKKFDVSIVGHITKEVIRVKNIKQENPGGTAYYTSIPLHHLGWSVAVITKVAKNDQPILFRRMEQDKITIFRRETTTTTLFENTYQGDALDQRIQRINAIADPFSWEDIADVSAPVIHLGPLTKNEIPVEMIETLSKSGAMVSLDVQGFLRDVKGGTVIDCDWEEKRNGLAFVDILKADQHEATILTGENDPKRAASKLTSWGPKEVIITSGGRGSIIFRNNVVYRIPAFRPRRLVNPTGCGDTYMAGYLYHRFQHPCDFDKIGRFAAKIATLNLEILGPVGKEKIDDLNIIKANFNLH